MVTQSRRTPQVQTAHDVEVRRRYNSFRADPRWSNVRADLPDAVKPDLYNGHRPDVSGRYSGTLWLLEVETADTYASRHAQEQYVAFAKAAKLIVDVPQSVVEATKRILARLNITAKVWGY